MNVERAFVRFQPHPLLPIVRLRHGARGGRRHREPPPANRQRRARLKSFFAREGRPLNAEDHLAGQVRVDVGTRLAADECPTLPHQPQRAAIRRRFDDVCAIGGDDDAAILKLDVWHERRKAQLDRRGESREPMRRRQVVRNSRLRARGDRQAEAQRPLPH